MAKYRKPSTGKFSPSKGKRKARGTSKAEVWRDRYFKWNSKNVDLEHEYLGFNELNGNVIFPEVIDILQNLETQKWSQICNFSKKRHNHPMEITVIEKFARDRFLQINHDSKFDTDEVFQLGVGNKPRIWGVRSKEIFYLLWWDPEHKVYPVEKKS